MKIPYLNILLSLIFSSVSLPSIGTSLPSTLEIDGLQFRIIQISENPIWMELIGISSKSNLTPIHLEDQYSLKGFGFRDGLRNPDEIRPAVVEQIGDEALRQAQIKNFHIPATVKRIGKSAFSGSQLQAVTFSEGLLSIGEGAFNATPIKSIKLPESLLLIEYGAFMFCEYLEEIDLPSTLIALSGFTFRYSGTLQHVYCRASQPPAAAPSDFGVMIDDYGPYIDHVPGPDLHKCILHVPEESIDLYRNAPGWCLFENIVPIEETTAIGEDALEENLSSISYNIEGNTLIIPGIAGDTVSVYDVDGHILESYTFSTDGEFRHQGSGVRIISFGDKSVKTIL